MKRIATLAIMLGATTLLGATVPAPKLTRDCEAFSHSCDELRACIGGELPESVECVDVTR